jgi:eukaryotic-like serine/threonine-protein kinase
MTATRGTVFAERYELLDRIATGGMGEVWRARDTVLGRDVALKTLKAEYADDPTFLSRFEGEARHTAGLSHPGIAAVFDYGKDGDTPFLVMELVDGEPLSHLLAREGRLSTEDTLTIVGQAATALHHAHAAGVIHRDVKPGNILVTPEKTVKVTDFGIARAGAATPVTQTGMVLGTAHYLSPEQGTGGEVTPASDVYSLGVVTYECLAGRRPFAGDSAVGIAMAHVSEPPPPLPDDVPEPARMLVEQAMAKIPEERFANAGAFARAAALLQERLHGSITEPLATAVALPTVVRPHQAAPVRVPAPLPTARTEHGSRNRLLVALLAALILLVLAAAYAAVQDDGGTPPSTAGRRTTNPPAPMTTGPKLIALPGGLIGRDADEVAAELRRLGLRVEQDTTESDARRGTVLRVRPSSALLPGSTVTLLVSRGEDEGRGKGKKDEKGQDGDDD